MRSATILLLLAVCGVAFGHGENARSNPNAGSSTPTIVIRTGGPTTPSKGKRGGVTTPTAASSGTHNWEIWWAYNREYYLAKRTRGTPVTGLGQKQQVSQKKGTLVEKKLLPIMLRALDDKSPEVREAAAVALGKFGFREAARPLRRRLYVRNEGWWTVREAATYGLSLLGLPDERSLWVNIAGDKEYGPTQQGLALFGLLLDRSPKSAEILEWHMRFKKSDAIYRGEVLPKRGEGERRRVAAHLLGFVKSPSYDKALWRAVLSDNRYGPAERGLAVTAIGRLKKKEYKRDMLRLVRSRSQKHEVTRSAVIAYGQLVDKDDDDGLAELERIASRDLDAPTRHFAVMALAQIGGKKAGDRLVSMYNRNVRPGETDRGFLYLALGLVHTENARDTLFFAYRKTGVRDLWPVMMLACGMAGERRAVPITMDRIKRTSLSGGQKILAYGSLGLGFHSDARGLPTVKEVLRKYADSFVREHSAIGLVLLQRAHAAPRLLELLKEGGSLQKKTSAIIALSLLVNPDEKIVDALIAAYRRDSNQNSARAAAIIALGNLGDPRKMPLSAQFMRHYNYFIRSGALDVVATLF